MKVVNIAEAKAKLSEYLDAVASGESVVICKRNQPVAELRAVSGVRTTPRPVGGAAGRLVVAPAFFDPLPEEVVSSFFPGGEAEAPEDRPSRAAERPPACRARPPRRPRK